jgi:hypothetical protein
MKPKLLLAASCLVCLDVASKSFLVFEGSEFRSGSLAGNKDLGAFLVVLALILIFKYARFAAVSALAGCLLSLPLYLYLVFPRPFRQIWAGNWKVMELPRESFIWDGWWITGSFSIVFVAYISCCTLIPTETRR